MPRPLRPIDDRLVYHVINRGNNRQPVFFSDGDYEAFLRALADLKRRRPFAVYGFCLMPNHFHLLIRPLDTPISRIMQSLLVSHTQRYHRCHHSGGHVWQGRFKSPVIQDDEHLLTVLRYIEANPLRARMVEAAGDYRWSSFPAHGLGRPEPLLDPLTVYDSLAKTPSTRQHRWSGFVHQSPSDEELTAVRRSCSSGLPFGAPAWVDGLAARLGLDLTIRSRGRPRKTPAATEL
jgi:putative transposase